MFLTYNNNIQILVLYYQKRVKGCHNIDDKKLI